MQPFKKITYAELNARQQENYNFQKISSLLADYGFATLRLTDDWQGADFIANHIDGETFLKVQLKGRFSFNKKYIGKNIWIAFCAKGAWYLYPHDEVMKQLGEHSNFENTQSWKELGVVHNGNPTKQDLEMLKPYLLSQE